MINLTKRSLPTPLTAMVLFGAALAVGGAGCEKATPDKKAPKPADVTVQKAAQEEVTDFEDFTGRLEAVKKVELQARVTGFLKKVNFTEGGIVKKDKVLFEIDPRPYKAELDKADATVVQAKARMSRLESDMTRAMALLRSRSISKEEFEKVTGDYAEAAASVGVAKASRESAALFHSYTKVKSPFAGKVGRTMIDPGNLVKADMTVLATIVSDTPIYAYFDVDERTHLRLQRLLSEKKIPAMGSNKVAVRLSLADEIDFPHEGFIDFEDTYIDSATGTRRMRGVFENEKGLFTPGMFVRIRLQVGLPYKATVISEQGVGTDQSEKYVYVVDAQNDVEKRMVATGALWKGRRVILSGLRPGELVVVSGLQKVRTGKNAPKVNPIEQPIGPTAVVGSSTKLPEIKAREKN